MDSSAGLDGWSARELQALPLRVLQVLATLFNKVEAGLWAMPRLFGTARLAVLDLHILQGQDLRARVMSY